MSLFSPYCFCISSSCFFFSAWYSRALRTFIAEALFLCCERSFWQVTTIPVGACVIRTAESVTFTCCPPAPLERKVSIRRSLSSTSTSMSSGISGMTSTEAKEVWRLFPESKGDILTSLWTPFSALRKPKA